MQKSKQQQKQVVAVFGSEPNPGLVLRSVGSSERPSCLLIMDLRLAKSQASLIPWQMAQGLLHIKAAGLWGIWRLPLQVSEEYKRYEGRKPALKGNSNT